MHRSIRFTKTNIFVYALILVLIWKLMILGINWREPWHTYLTNIGRVIKYVIYLFLIVKYTFDMRSMNTSQFLFFLVSLLSVIISYKVTNENTILFSFLMCMLAKDTVYKQVLKDYVKTQILIFIVMIISVILSLADNVTVIFGYGIGYSLGMYHPNNTAGLMLSILLCWNYLHNYYSLLHRIIVCSITGIIIWYITASRTCTVLVLIYIFLLLFYQLIKKIGFKKIFKKSKFIIIIAFLFSVYMTSKYSTLLDTNLIDTNFFVRFTMAYRLYKEYGLHLFGSYIEFRGMEAATILGGHAIILDNAYLKLAIYYGIVPTIIITWLLRGIFVRLYKIRNIELLLMAILFIIYGFMESSVLMIQYNFTLLAFLCSSFSITDSVYEIPTLNRQYIN